MVLFTYAVIHNDFGFGHVHLETNYQGSFMQLCEPEIYDALGNKDEFVRKP